MTLFFRDAGPQPDDDRANVTDGKHLQFVKGPAHQLSEETNLRYVSLNVNCAKVNCSPFDLIDEIAEFIKTHKIDILHLCETDFPSLEDAADFSVENFSTILPTKLTVSSIRTPGI